MDYNNSRFKSYCLLILLPICMYAFRSTEAFKKIDPSIQLREDVKINGDTFDCVNILEQPAFNNPLLKDHKIQMKPSTSVDNWKNIMPENNFLFPWQTMNSCPNGTIPVHVGGGSFGIGHGPKNEQGTFKYASYAKSGDREFRGIHGKLNVWSPHTVRGDFSATRVSLSASYHDETNSIAAGWMVNPHQFDDRHPRMFVFYTNDNYTTACYNFNCTGFVITTQRPILNAPCTRASTQSGEQIDVDVKIIQDHTTKNWWLKVSDHEVGYWPTSLVPGLHRGASVINWGGQVYKAIRSENPSSMGSGEFPEAGYKKASYIREVQYVDKDYKVVDSTHLSPFVTDPTCYRVSQLESHAHHGVYFYYGGSGHEQY